MQNITVRNGLPVNGIDVSHWNGKAEDGVPVPSWVSYYGMKAAHVGGSKMLDGFKDPLLEYNRHRARTASNVEFIGMYLYLVRDIPMATQVNALAEAVGYLSPGEFVFIDWEEKGSRLDTEGLYYLNSIYPQRWGMYVNDMDRAMTNWLENNAGMTGPKHIPVLHPDWRPEGWKQAKRFEASVWQQGWADVPGYAGPIDINLVTRPNQMKRIAQSRATVSYSGSTTT